MNKNAAQAILYKIEYMNSDDSWYQLNVRIIIIQSNNGTKVKVIMQVRNILITTAAAGI